MNMFDNRKYVRHLCECGCGEFAKVGNRYIVGHNRRLIRKLIIREIRTCECGCRQTFECKVNSNKKYISGHNSRGRLHSEETKEKIRKVRTGTRRSKETIAKMTGDNNPNKRPSVREKISKFAKRRWQNPEYREKHLKAIFAARGSKPNKSEKKLRNGLNKLFPNEYKYVGDGTTFIGGKNPDFININGQKKIIELFGTYWHSKEVTGRTKKQEENQRTKHFAKYGFKILIVWESELQDISKLEGKIILFHRISQ